MSFLTLGQHSVSNIMGQLILLYFESFLVIIPVLTLISVYMERWHLMAPGQLQHILRGRVMY